LDYLEQQLGRKIDIVETDSYAEVCNLLKYKEVDFAFVNPQSYIDGHKDFGMELLTAPVISGNSQSRAYIIARDDSQVNEFKDLKGKVLALTDPKSDKMCQLPLYMLGAETGNPRKYFKNCVFSFGSDETIDVVALGLADGGLVNSVVWDYLRSKNYKYALKTKIIWKSPVFCSPPVVVHPALPQAVKDELQKAFLTANEYKKGKQALDDMMIDKYVVVDDSDYGSLREIESYFADNLPDERRRTEKK
jgi:phosphonate transport system substrate-binding protein